MRAKKMQVELIAARTWGAALSGRIVYLELELDKAVALALFWAKI
jgi:hypothetical protein